MANKRDVAALLGGIMAAGTVVLGYTEDQGGSRWTACLRVSVPWGTGEPWHGGNYQDTFVATGALPEEALANMALRAVDTLDTIFDERRAK